MTHRAIVVDRPLPDARPEAVLRRLETVNGPQGDAIDVDVLYSSVNYKDAIALTGGPGILRNLPMTPGIDVVGRVRSSAHGWSSGDIVVVNGGGLGERFDGGLAERAAVPAPYAIAVPEGMTPRTAAAIGTAGFTAALAVRAVQAAGIAPGDGEILVTGAGGGVGSFAIALLAAQGYEVVASTGRESLADALIALGASRVVGRDEVDSGGKPLQSSRWAGVVDSVGSSTLVNALAQTRYGGVVTACGLAQGADLPGTVLPFILRAVTLVGINSVEAPLKRRTEAWAQLAQLPIDVVDRIAPRTEPLDRSTTVAREVLAGRVAGRVVIDTRG